MEELVEELSKSPRKVHLQARPVDTYPPVQDKRNRSLRHRSLGSGPCLWNRFFLLHPAQTQCLSELCLGSRNLRPSLVHIIAWSLSISYDGTIHGSKRMLFCFALQSDTFIVAPFLCNAPFIHDTSYTEVFCTGARCTSALFLRQ